MLRYLLLLLTAFTFPHYKLWDYFGYFVSLYDGTCDQTKELKTLTRIMPNNDKWVISSSGHHMFVSFNVYIFESNPGFLAKIHFGKEINDIKNGASKTYRFIFSELCNNN